MTNQLATKTTKDNDKQRKIKSNEATDNGSSNKTNWVEIIDNFITQQNKDLSISNTNLYNINERCEKIRLSGFCKKSLYEELQRNLETKRKEFDELNGRFEKLDRYFANLRNALLEQSKKHTILETSYQESHCSLEAELKSANEQIYSMQKKLDAKEAECAAYLKDMRVQLENANQRNLESETNVSDLKQRISELEDTLETYKEEESIKKKNILEKHEKELQLKKNKINKRNKTISELKKKIETLENDKKELQGLMELEGHKIRDLQRVLNRPISRTTAMSEDINTNETVAHSVAPFRNLNDTSSGNSQRFSQEQEDFQVSQSQNELSSLRRQIMKRRSSSSSDQDSDDINNFVNNTRNGNDSPSSIATTVIAGRNSATPFRECNGNENAPLSLNTDNDSSDEINFPPYEWPNDNTIAQGQAHPFEAKRAKK